jgi:hypothetical protein
MATTTGSADYDKFDELAEEFAARFRRGERPALQEYIDRYPALAGPIRELFPALVEVERADVEQQDLEQRERENASVAATVGPPLPRLVARLWTLLRGTRARITSGRQLTPPANSFRKWLGCC